MADDYSFMRTGIAGATAQSDVEVNFLRKVASILKVLLKQAISTAERFTRACGRTIITARDTQLALKFEAHEFCTRSSLEDDFTEALSEEQEHTYETESDETDSEETEVNSEGEQEGEENYCTAQSGNHETFTETFAGNEHDREFHNQVLIYDREWIDWHPEDIIQRFIKRGVDSIQLADCC